MTGNSRGFNYIVSDIDGGFPRRPEKDLLYFSKNLNSPAGENALFLMMSRYLKMNFLGKGNISWKCKTVYMVGF